MTDNRQKPAVPNYVPDVGRLVTDRFDFQQHVNGTGFRHVANQIDMSPLITISGEQPTNVQDAIALLAEAASPVLNPATTTTLGIVQLSGDIAGTATNVRVVNIQGRPISTLPPSTGQVLTWQSGGFWSPQNVNNGAAGGDLRGTYPNPLVIALDGYKFKTPTNPLNGQVPTWVSADGYIEWNYTGQNVVVYQPGGTAGGNVYTTFAGVYAFAQTLGSAPVTIYLDSTHSSTFTVPAGTYTWGNQLLTILGSGGPGPPMLQLQAGVVWNGILSMNVVGAQLTNASTSSTPISFSDALNHTVQIFSHSFLNVEGGCQPLMTITNTTSGHLFIESDGGTIGGLPGGGAPVITVTGGVSTLTLVIDANASTISASCVSAAVAGNAQIVYDANSSISLPQTNVTLILDDIAAQVSYNDGYVSPTIGAVTVQAAIDYLKQHSGSGGTIAGDVTGTLGSSTVVKLRGKNLSTTLSSLGAAQDGYALTWDNTDGYWFAESPPAYQWATNASPVTLSDTAAHIITSVTIVPTVTGRLIASATGYVNNLSEADTVSLGMFYSIGAGNTTNIAPIGLYTIPPAISFTFAATVDLPFYIISNFPINEPWVINICAQAGTANDIQFPASGCNLEVEENLQANLLP